MFGGFHPLFIWCIIQNNYPLNNSMYNENHLQRCTSCLNYSFRKSIVIVLFGSFVSSQRANGAVFQVDLQCITPSPSISLGKLNKLQTQVPLSNSTLIVIDGIYKSASVSTSSGQSQSFGGKMHDHHQKGVWIIVACQRICARTYCSIHGPFSTSNATNKVPSMGCEVIPSQPHTGSYNLDKYCGINLIHINTFLYFIFI